MIVTITLNTGFDETFVVSRIDVGQVSHLHSYQSIPSGKGINAGRTIHALGGHCHLVGFVGEDDAALFHRRLSVEGLSGTFATAPGSTRRNLTLFERDTGAPASHFRADGFVFRTHEPFESLLRLVTANVRPGDLVSLHGSTPNGLPQDAWVHVAKAVQDRGAKILLDIYDKPLPLLLDAVQVLACKVNRHEVSTLPSVSDLPTDRAAFTALQVMLDRGVEFPFVTLGAGGIAFVDGHQFCRASCAAPHEAVFVGAGDACMGALTLFLEQGSSSSRELATSMAAVGAAHVSGVGHDSLKSTASELLHAVSIGPLMDW